MPMLLDELKNKKILILGYGIEGQSTLNFLHTYFPEKTIGIADKKYGDDYLKKQYEYDIVIKSPGIPKRLVKIPYTTATNIFFANVIGKIIGVTGSKGKSTTASLIHAMLKEANLPSHLVGNIGNPMLYELLRANGTNDIWVVELSSYQLDDINYSPHVSVFLNFFPEHMDYHGGIEEYWEAKKRIIAIARPDDYLIYNPAYAQLLQLAREIKINAIPFIDTLPFPDAVIPLLGNHNRDNVRASSTAASLFNVPEEAMERAVRNFQPLPHRLELVGSFKGITFYDDAISTTPESTIAAIQSLPFIGTIFLGGEDRGYDFSLLAKTVIQYKIPNIVCFPKSGKRILQSLQIIQAASQVPARILETSDMREAVLFAYANSPQGSICLLSTASPSYSVWKNFEEKGNLFQHWVKTEAAA